MFRIDSRHRLLQHGKLVRRIMSPYHSGNFSNPPAITVMHFTYGASARSSADWFSSKKNSRRSSAHIVISRDGAVFQCVDFDRVAHHAGVSFWKGVSGLNRHSFGIELANWGHLQNRNGVWTSHTGRHVADPVLAVHRNGNPDKVPGPIGWEPFSEVQIDTAAAIVRLLGDIYGPQEIIGHDDISVGRKWDPGPAFDMVRFRQLAVDDDGSDATNLLLVNTPGDSLNLRAGPGIHFAVERALADGSIVEPLSHVGSWALVNVLNDALAAEKSGWINTRHTVAA